MPGRFNHERCHTARKPTTRRCWLCGSAVQVGEEYIVRVWRDGHQFDSMVAHTLCDTVLNLLTDDPYDLDEYCLGEFDPHTVQAVLDTNNFTEAECATMDARLDLTNRLAEDD